MIRLADLIHPLGVEEFLQDFWEPQRPCVAHGEGKRLGELFSIPEFQSVESLVEVTSHSVKLFGPDRFRSHVPAGVAIDFYGRGDTLYFTGIEQDVSAALPLRSGLASDLGVPDDAVYFEAFAARAGATSTFHYDWDINFQVLLRGRKTWRIAPNRNVANPLFSLVPGQRWGDEAFALDRELPDSMPDDATTLETVAGDVLFLPRGLWHETSADEDCFGVNFVVGPMTWADALSRAFRRRLEQHEEFRAFAFGGMGTGSLVDSGHAEFERLKSQFVDVAGGLQLDEVARSKLSLEWKWRADRRGELHVNSDGTGRLECEPDAFELPASTVETVRRLLPLRHRFGLAEANGLACGLCCDEIVELLSNLVAAGFLEP